MLLCSLRCHHSKMASLVAVPSLEHKLSRFYLTTVFQVSRTGQCHVRDSVTYGTSGPFIDSQEILLLFKHKCFDHKSSLLLDVLIEKMPNHQLTF